MTVKELIKILQGYPKDSLVAINYNIDISKNDISLIDEFYVDDSSDDGEVLKNKVVGIGVQ